MKTLKFKDFKKTRTIQFLSNFTNNNSKNRSGFRVLPQFSPGQKSVHVEKSLCSIIRRVKGWQSYRHALTGKENRTCFLILNSLIKSQYGFATVSIKGHGIVTYF